ncbi:hypothetical protein IAU59_004702 [Kwoniella sp. CBS 9459]
MGLRPSPPSAPPPPPSLVGEVSGIGPTSEHQVANHALSQVHIQGRPRIIRLRVQPEQAQSPSAPTIESSSPTGTHSTLPLSQSSQESGHSSNSSIIASASGSGGPTPPTSPLPELASARIRTRPRTRKRQRRDTVDDDPEAGLTGDRHMEADFNFNVDVGVDDDFDMGSDAEYVPPPSRSTFIRLPSSAAIGSTRSSSTPTSNTLLRGGGKKPPKSRRSAGTVGASYNGHNDSNAYSSSNTSHAPKHTSTRRTTRSKARRASSPSDLITTSLEEIALEDTAVKNEVARLGLCLRDVKGDGNCLFRVLSDQGFGGEKRHAEIRKLVCDYLESHKNVMEGFVVPFMKDGEGYEGYVTRMRQLKQFGSHIEIQAAARVFKRNIRVVMSTTSFTIPWRTEAVPDVAATPTPSEVGPVLPKSSLSTPSRRAGPKHQSSSHHLSPASIVQTAVSSASASTDFLPSTKEDRGMLWLALFSQAEHFQSIRRMGDREHGPAEVEDRLAVPHERDVSEAARRERGELIDEKSKKVPMSESSKLNQLFASLPPGHGISADYAQGILSRVKGDIGEAVEILLEEIDQAGEGADEGSTENSSDASSSSERVEGILSSPPPQASPELPVHAHEHATGTIMSAPSYAGLGPAGVVVHPPSATTPSMDRKISDYRSHSRNKSKSTSSSDSHSTATTSTTSTESRSISLSLSTSSRSRSRSNSSASSLSSTDLANAGSARSSADADAGSRKRKDRGNKTKELSHGLEGMGLVPEAIPAGADIRMEDIEMNAKRETQKQLQSARARAQRDGRERGDKERRRSARLGVVGA